MKNKYLTLQRIKKPDANQTIMDDMEFDLDKVNELLVYEHKKEECECGKQYWMIELSLLNGTTIFLMMPIEMTEKEILKFVSPITDKFRSRLH